MTAQSTAASGALPPDRLTRVVRGTLFTTAVAVMFGLSVIVEVSNVPEVASRPDGAAVAANDPAAPAAVWRVDLSTEGQATVY